MLSYLAFAHHGIPAAGYPLDDGRTLAKHCVNQLKALNDPEQFPPRLLILLASPAYLNAKAEQLLAGVYEVFDESAYGLPLIGCSVAAVFFNRRIYREGALLVCLASRLLKAKVGVTHDVKVSSDRKKAVTNLLQDLNLLTERDEKIHSFANRTLLALFPGFAGNEYLAPELHELLRNRLGGRVAIFGGVASANDPERTQSGLVFANRETHRHKLVAASIECGTPFGISFTQGLTDIGQTLTVAEVDRQDPRIIRQFRDGPMSEIINGIMACSPVPLLAKLTLDRDPTVDAPTLAGETLKLSRRVNEGDPFHVLIPTPEKMLETFKQGVKESLDSAFLMNPIAALGFRCSGLLRHSERIGANPVNENAEIGRFISGEGSREKPFGREKPFVGGFVDGEVGVDKNGKSVLGNWSNATLVFGDELRFRTPVYRGFEELAYFAGIKVAEDHSEGIDRLTRLIFGMGFPGAMLSLLVKDDERDALVAQSASGSRFGKLLGEMKPIPVDSNDILAIVAKENRPRTIIKPNERDCYSVETAKSAGVTSQHIIPLAGIKGQVNAVLQIDLGDISYDTGLYDTEITVLEALGKIVSAGLNRTFNWEESQIIRRLDEAMNSCLSAETINLGLQRYLEKALKAFGLGMGGEGGHIRIAQEDEHTLKLVAGIGDSFQESRKIRAKIGFAEASPTAQAFRDEKIVIVNDPHNNKAHQAMCEQWKREAGFHEKLREVGSYANVPFKSERGERGSINLVSSKPWFFTWFHDGPLKALGERVAFLLETLRRKESEALLLGVSPQFSSIQNLNDSRKILGRAIDRFARDTRAELASLYLWENDRQQYTLRAQYGWADPDWIEAAYYGKNEIWTGTAALAGKPCHILNLFDYYQKNSTSKRYTIQAFGRDLSADFTAEAMGLQLRVADDRLGVLTLYRRIKPGEESGFVTTDMDLLQRGADNFASLISILESRGREAWRRLEHKRRQDVFEATVPSKGADFEKRVCQQALKSYHAARASFYRAYPGRTDAFFENKAAFQRSRVTNRIVEMTLPSEDLDLVRQTVLANHNERKELFKEQIKIPKNEMTDPRRAALNNHVKRVCIPLISEKELVGVLDLHWSFNPRPINLPDYQHGENYLRMLGDVVGVAYGRSLDREQAEAHLKEGNKKLNQSKSNLRESRVISTRSARIILAYLAQYQHELRNLVQDVGSNLRSLQEIYPAHPEHHGSQLIDELLQLELKMGETLRKIEPIGTRLIRPVKKVIALREVIRLALEKDRDRSSSIHIDVTSLDAEGDLSVYVDDELLASAISNLLNNAITAMKDRVRKEMTVRILPDDGAVTATILLEDTGVGMSDEMIQRLLNGFFSHNGRTSYGVPIAHAIIEICGGSLTYESQVGVGTKTLINLPLKQAEEY